MACPSCKSKRLCRATAKCSDMFDAYFYETNMEYIGYVPKDMGIGGGNYMELTYCLNCGKILGNFPCFPESETQEEEIH